MVQAGSDRLSKWAAPEIAAAEHVDISAISLWEVTTLVRFGRVALDRPAHRWVADLLAGPVDCIDVDASIAADAGSLEAFHGDPADRIIYATAAQHRLTLLTKDRRLTDHAAELGSVDVIW